MGYRVIYIEKCEYLRLYLDNLKVEIKNDTLLIPVSDIQILVIDNYQSNLSVPLINKLTDNNVCTIICGGGSFTEKLYITDEWTLFK